MSLILVCYLIGDNIQSLFFIFRYNLLFSVQATKIVQFGKGFQEGCAYAWPLTIIVSSALAHELVNEFFRFRADKLIPFLPVYRSMTNLRRIYFKFKVLLPLIHKSFLNIWIHVFDKRFSVLVTRAVFTPNLLLQNIVVLTVETSSWCITILIANFVVNMFGKLA